MILFFYGGQSMLLVMMLWMRWGLKRSGLLPVVAMIALGLSFQSLLDYSWFVGPEVLPSPRVPVVVTHWVLIGLTLALMIRLAVGVMSLRSILLPVVSRFKPRGFFLLWLALFIGVASFSIGALLGEAPWREGVIPLLRWGAWLEAFVLVGAAQFWISNPQFTQDHSSLKRQILHDIRTPLSALKVLQTSGIFCEQESDSSSTKEEKAEVKAILKATQDKLVKITQLLEEQS